MTHADKNHYAAKHPGAVIDEKTASLIREKSQDSNVTCAAAHKAAEELNVSPETIGVQADLMEFRIAMCQMGLFGYTGGSKQMDPEFDIPAAMEKAIQEADDDGRISCRTCWQMAEQLNAKRMDIASACEKMGIRIKPCQLGAF